VIPYGMWELSRSAEACCKLLQPVTLLYFMLGLDYLLYVYSDSSTIFQTQCFVGWLNKN